MRRIDFDIKSIEYDIDSSKLRSQPDLDKLIQFCEEGAHQNMCIEYSTNADATRRRRVLQAWLRDSKYHYAFYTKVRDNKLYIFREGDNA